MLAFSLEATAQHVVLVRSAESDAVLVEAFNRLTAELRLQSFDVMVVEAPADFRGAATLEILAHQMQAQAAVALVRHAGTTAVEVWLDDRAGGRPTSYRLEPAAGTELPSVLAIRVVDLLRVSLRELKSETDAQVVRLERSVAPDSTNRVTPTPTRAAWEIRAEGIVIYDNATLGAVFGAGLGVARYLSETARVGILVSGPLIGASWDTPEGSAFVRQELALGEVRLSWWRARRLDLGASVAAGAHYLTAHSSAREPLLSQTGDVWSLAGALGVDGSFRLASNAAVSVTVRAVSMTPRAGVGLGSSTTVLGWPLVSASAGFLVGF